MFRPIKIRHYVSLMKTRGFDTADVLQGSKIKSERLDDPSYLLDLKQCEAVVSNLIRLTGDQGIGLTIGEQENLADFGIIAQAMISSKDLRQAVGYWIQYSNLVGMLIHITLIEEPRKEWTVVFSATEPLGFIYNFCVEEILVAGLRLGSALGKVPLVVKEISLSYPAPLHAHLYKERFGCPIHFNAARSSLTIKSPGLDIALPGYDEELNDIYRRRCREVIRQIRSKDPLVARLRSLLLSRSSSLPDLETAAGMLGTTPRTLHRHLVSEGSNYQQTVNRFRLELCIQLLRSGDLTLKEIAVQVGFRDTNSLHRAFKSWTGSTIRTYQSSRKFSSQPRG
ncbi:MAG: AraC family transcriptional regulator [Hydrocarboniphaga sp.]|uniref:AraC family transcriptional regulator n=1 Tax=Hydrocarboniphaga sp. TaxID=2033016 RepID=UPI0026071674|nr:AraC family transcriptional regulator [Hydrocarboniphaga sp.]MDB5968384.1 AraC family transcriptional regulator [Hydrocarboniphaga sp.]